MDEIFVNKLKNFNAPATATTLTIYHELGDIVLSAGPVVSGIVAYTPTSIGVHKLLWKNGTTLVKTEFFSVVMQLTTDLDFFNDYESLESTYGDDFPALERRTRLLIEQFCNQKFGPLLSKTIEVKGTGGRTLELPYRIINFYSITDQWADDLSDLVIISPGSEWWLEYMSTSRTFNDRKRDISIEPNNFFNEHLIFSIQADFGWEYIPSEVNEAAKLIISDTMNGVTDLQNHGYKSAQLGDFQYQLATGKMGDQWSTTGNAVADNLLAPYVIFPIGLV